MWAAAANDSPIGNNELIIAVFAFLGIVATVVGGVLVALINSRADRTAPSPPAPIPPPGRAADFGHLSEDVAVLRYRADDTDEHLDLLDRRLGRLEHHVETDDPRPHRGPHEHP